MLIFRTGCVVLHIAMQCKLTNLNRGSAAQGLPGGCETKPAERHSFGKSLGLTKSSKSAWPKCHELESGAIEGFRAMAGRLRVFQAAVAADPASIKTDLIVRL